MHFVNASGADSVLPFSNMDLSNFIHLNIKFRESKHSDGNGNTVVKMTYNNFTEDGKMIFIYDNIYINTQYISIVESNNVTLINTLVEDSNTKVLVFDVKAGGTIAMQASGYSGRDDAMHLFIALATCSFSKTEQVLVS